MKTVNYAVIMIIMIASAGCSKVEVGRDTIQNDAKKNAHLIFEYQQIFKNKSFDDVELKLNASELYTETQQLKLEMESKYTSPDDLLSFQIVLDKELKKCKKSFSNNKTE